MLSNGILNGHIIAQGKANLHQTNIIAPGEGEPAPNFKDQRRRAVQHESKQPVRIIIIISNYATQHLTMLNQSIVREGTLYFTSISK